MSAGIALAVLGDPLAYTRSPALHRAGLAAVGVPGSSAALRTSADALGERLRELAAHGFRGANLTTPLKEIALEHVDRVSEPARRARSVNTIGFGPDGTWGDTTDGPGFADFLGTLGRDPGRERVWILGAGGAARSVALALVEIGASVAVSARRPEAARASWRGIPGVVMRSWGAAPPVAEPTLVINATPSDPARLDRLPRRTLIVDLRYG
ncbi:MAG: shikimate dehydrogenase, partial [Candidatus Eisenbacteria bacterium]